MSEEINKPEKDDSSESPKIDHSTILGVSVRAWIAVIVILTVCAMSISKIDIKEPLYTLAGLIVGFYFGANPPKSKSS